MLIRADSHAEIERVAHPIGETRNIGAIVHLWNGQHHGSEPADAARRHDEIHCVGRRVECTGHGRAIETN